ncbi:MAG: dTMP kinase [Coriobacteriales bacterium]|jgi:dTMP kinase
MRGCFITFEGGEGVGKSTQISRLAERLEGLGREVVLLREPGSTHIGEQVRQILLDMDNCDIDPICELLLYEASRAQMVNQTVIPAVESGKVVLCDRFTDSTMAYQGYARGLGRNIVRAANKVACGDLVPDRTILLERNTSVSLELARSCGGADRLESEPEEFHDKVHAAFRSIAAHDPDRVRAVAVADDIDETERRVWAEVEDLFAEDVHGSASTGSEAAATAESVESGDANSQNGGASDPAGGGR